VKPQPELDELAPFLAARRLRGAWTLEEALRLVRALHQRATTRIILNLPLIARGGPGGLDERGVVAWSRLLGGLVLFVLAYCALFAFRIPPFDVPLIGGFIAWSAGLAGGIAVVLLLAHRITLRGWESAIGKEVGNVASRLLEMLARHVDDGATVTLDLDLRPANASRYERKDGDTSRYVRVLLTGRFPLRGGQRLGVRVLQSVTRVSRGARFSPAFELVSRITVRLVLAGERQGAAPVVSGQRVRGALCLRRACPKGFVAALRRERKSSSRLETPEWGPLTYDVPEVDVEPDLVALCAADDV
jgi:hypothetical protein